MLAGPYCGMMLADMGADVIKIELPGRGDDSRGNAPIVYGCVSGLGHYGPYSKRAGYDIIGQAMSSLMSTTGWPDTPPTRTSTAISDVVGGLSCCIGVLAAYCNRLKTGVSDKVDISLVDGMVFSLKPIIKNWTKERKIDDIVELGLAAGIPAGPINTIDRVVADPHIAGAREMFVECDHPVAGKVKITNSHLKFTNNKTSIRMRSPLLGEHNEKILKERLGMSEEEIAKRRKENVF